MIYNSKNNKINNNQNIKMIIIICNNNLRKKTINMQQILYYKIYKINKLIMFKNYINMNYNKYFNFLINNKIQVN